MWLEHLQQCYFEVPFTIGVRDIFTLAIELDQMRLGPRPCVSLKRPSPTLYRTNIELIHVQLC